jgi:predicted DNA binding CopG/RHH family protein
MKSKIKYTDEPLEMEVVEDFLPPPEQLALRQDSVKVTISLSKPTVEFFKARARQNHTQYQRMIRRLLDLYAARFGG